MKEEDLQIQKFCDIITGPVIYDVDSPYALMMKKIDDIDIDYFQGEKPIADEIGNRLSPSIKTTILKDLSVYAETIVSQSNEIESKILDEIATLIHQYPSTEDAYHYLSTALVKIHNFARKKMPSHAFPRYTSNYSSADIKRLHAKAMKVTWYEKLTNSNDKDVMEYYHAIIYHIAFACYKLTRRKASQFLLHMVDVISREYDLPSSVATIYNDPPSWK